MVICAHEIDQNMGSVGAQVMRGQHFESTMHTCMLPRQWLALISSHSQPAWKVEGTHHGGVVLGLHVVSANLLRGGLLGSLDGLCASRGHGAERDAGSTCGKEPGATITGGA